MSLNINSQMDNIGVALATIVGLRVFDFLPASAQPPFCFIDFPESIVYDNTKARGTDTAVFPIFIGVGKVSDRSSRDQLAEYLAGTGSKSIKAAVDFAGLRRVMNAEVSVITLAGVDYLGARFDTEVTA
jgi:hypothetical protein